MSSVDYSELRTVLDFIRWGASRFREAQLSFAHGMASPLDEAAYLVLHTLHLPVDTPSVYFAAQLTTPERHQVAETLQERITTRKPAAYITREGWFAGLPFYVDERVLVPRSPLAECIEKQLHLWLDPQQVTRVLDLCTGSGCIGIACAYAFPQAQVDLSDISPDALAVARINIERHAMDKTVNAIQSDLFSHLAGQRYDLIISNPPYVDAAEMDALTPEFRHEPTLGLAAGVDGLDSVRTILEQAHSHLTEQGILVVEVGNSQAALMAAYPEVKFYWLDFERGGGGVFLLTAEQLAAHFG